MLRNFKTLPSITVRTAVSSSSNRLVLSRYPRAPDFTSSVDALGALTADASLFDLVITGMHMPNLKGMQLAEELTVIRSDIPVIICTGFSERINREKSDAIVINGFLIKSVAKSEMVKMVRKVLDQPKYST